MAGAEAPGWPDHALSTPRQCPCRPLPATLPLPALATLALPALAGHTYPSGPNSRPHTPLLSPAPTAHPRTRPRHGHRRRRTCSTGSAPSCGSTSSRGTSPTTRTERWPLTRARSPPFSCQAFWCVTLDAPTRKKARRENEKQTPDILGFDLYLSHAHDNTHMHALRHCMCYHVCGR